MAVKTSSTHNAAKTASHTTLMVAGVPMREHRGAGTARRQRKDTAAGGGGVVVLWDTQGEWSYHNRVPRRTTMTAPGANKTANQWGVTESSVAVVVTVQAMFACRRCTVHAGAIPRDSEEAIRPQYCMIQY